MAVIKGGTSGTDVEVDSTPKAIRVISYKVDGTPEDDNFTGSYIARLDITPTTVAVGTTYWTMKNTGIKTAYITKLEMKVGFSGTAAATKSVYEIARFSGTTPSGGATIAAIKKSNAMVTPSIGDIRVAAAGVTTTGITFEQPWHIIAHTNQLNIDHAQDIHFDVPLQLAPGEGLAIRASTILVAGSYLVGCIRWEEK
ncbi:MAG TPA: hypothetical protein VGB43_06295 [Flavobacterium sp.]